MPRYTQFANKQQKIIALFNSGSYPECYQLLNEMAHEFPLMLDKLAFWKASLQLTEGKEKESINTLQQAFDKGHWISPEMFDMDDEFKVLEHSPDFKELIRQFNEALARKRATSRPLLLEKGYPIAKTGVYALHMRYSNAEIFSEIFLNRETQKQFAFGFAQSSQVISSHAFVWDDERQAKTDIETTLNMFQRNHSFENLIVTGGSQGGRYAIETALQHPSVKGFIAVIPYIQDLSAIKQLASQGTNGVKGVVIAGELEASYESTLKLVDVLKENDIPHHFISIKDMGHTIPEDFIRYFVDAIDYILT